MREIIISFSHLFNKGSPFLIYEAIARDGSVSELLRSALVHGPVVHWLVSQTGGGAVLLRVHGHGVLQP